MFWKLPNCPTFQYNSIKNNHSKKIEICYKPKFYVNEHSYFLGMVKLLYSIYLLMLNWTCLL